MSKDQHEQQKIVAQGLIDQGRVRTWADLGRAFGISSQAAHSRFGNGYRLELPPKAPARRYMVTAALDADLEARIERARAATPRRGRLSRAEVVRSLLARHLPPA